MHRFRNEIAMRILRRFRPSLEAIVDSSSEEVRNTIKAFRNVSLIFFTGLTAMPLMAQSDRASLLMYLQRSVQRQTSGVVVSDVVLQGTATRSKDSNTSETATVTLRAQANGNSTFSLSAGNGTLNETTAISPGLRRLKVWHAGEVRQISPFANTTTTVSVDAKTQTNVTRPTTLFPVVPWQLPYFAIQSALATQGDLDIAPLSDVPSSQDIGIRMRYHTTDPKVILSSEKLGTYPNEIVLDHETLLPKSIVFRQTVTFKDPKSVYVAAHPAIEERIEYSDYKEVQGVSIPMHIRILMQNQPYLDIQLSSAQINTRLSIPTPSE